MEDYEAKNQSILGDIQEKMGKLCATMDNLSKDLKDNYVKREELQSALKEYDIMKSKLEAIDSTLTWLKRTFGALIITGVVGATIMFK